MPLDPDPTESHRSIQEGRVDCYEFIDDANKLAKLCQRWQSCDALAVDTEFARSQTFWPKVGLIQLSDGDEIFLIDPLPISERGLKPLKDLLCGDQGPKLILHACYEDLEVFRCLWGEIPQNIFDTQVAAAFLGLGLQLGYQRLVADVLQQSIPKEETRSDWLSRPLTDAQLQYAALDVAYLIPLYRHFVEGLQQMQRYSWAELEFERIRGVYQKDEDPQQYYLKFRSAWRFNSQQLCVLQALSCWREECARRRNLPRGFVLRDAVILELAENPPRSLKELADNRDIKRHIVREEGAKIYKLINIAWSNQGPVPQTIEPPLAKELRPLIKAMKSAAAKEAEKHNIAPELLLKKRDIEWVIKAALQGKQDQIGDYFTPWRAQILQPSLEAVLQRHQDLIEAHRFNSQR